MNVCMVHLFLDKKLKKKQCVKKANSKGAKVTLKNDLSMLHQN